MEGEIELNPYVKNISDMNVDVSQRWEWFKKMSFYSSASSDKTWWHHKLSALARHTLFASLMYL